ncbi:MAG: AMP-binding protein [Candidatus Competibacteraceae bacterium]
MNTALESSYSCDPGIVESMVALTRHWARQSPERLAYCFLSTGVETERLSFQELDGRARAIAARLQGLVVPGDRVLLLFPQGLDYIAAFLGCLYAGAIAVTASPPRDKRCLDRLWAVVDDCNAALALTTRELQEQYAIATNREDRFRRLGWLLSEEIAPDGADFWKPPVLSQDNLAMLQYTSGSTGRPKGVMVSHGNLLHNLAMMKRHLHQNPGTVIVSWLPLFHDMGLISMALAALYNGVPCYLMSSEDFVRCPRLWLEAITRYRGTCSAGPDFGYRHCIEKIGDTELRGLDLSSWETAITGSEPIRATTMERFSDRFAAVGFRPSALFAGYGLAESTVFVSGGFPARTRDFDRAALERGRAVATQSGDHALRLVCCGRDDQVGRLRVVDPETHCGRDAGQVGELWVRSASTGHGYWGRLEESTKTFTAHLSGDGTGSYLRTGDLGFLWEGELYICGRLKDMILIRGRNLFPGDIAAIVETCHPALKSGGVTAFGIDTGEEEELVVVAAVQTKDLEVAAVVAAIREGVATHFDAEVAAVVLLPGNKFARTTSGKTQHLKMRAAFLAGELPAVAAWYDPVLERRFGGNRPVEPALPSPRGEKTDPTGAPATLDMILTAEAGRRRQLMIACLSHKIAALTRLPLIGFHSGNSLLSLGFDSLKALELAHEIESRFGVILQLSELLRAPSIAALSEFVISRIPVTVIPTTVVDSARWEECTL